MFSDLYRFQSRQETRNSHTLGIRCTLVAHVNQQGEGTVADGDDGLFDRNASESEQTRPSHGHASVTGAPM